MHRRSSSQKRPSRDTLAPSRPRNRNTRSLRHESKERRYHTSLSLSRQARNPLLSGRNRAGIRDRQHQSGTGKHTQRDSSGHHAPVGGTQPACRRESSQHRQNHAGIVALLSGEHSGPHAAGRHFSHQGSAGPLHPHTSPRMALRKGIHRLAGKRDSEGRFRSHREEMGNIHSSAAVGSRLPDSGGQTREQLVS